MGYGAFHSKFSKRSARREGTWLSVTVAIALALLANCGTLQTSAADVPDAPSVRFLGRVATTGVGQGLMAWPSTALQVGFEGTAASVTLTNAVAGQPDHVSIYIDGNFLENFVVADQPTTYKVTTSGGRHTLLVAKTSEAGVGQVQMEGVSAGRLVSVPAAKGLIEIVGDSISAGYGDEASSVDCPSADDGLPANPNFENSMLAYGPQAAMMLHADWSVVAWSGKGLEVNHDGTTAQTMPQLFGLIDPTNPNSAYDFSREPNVLVVNLGTNDFYALSAGSTAAISAAQTQGFIAAYLSFIRQIRNIYPHTTIILAMGPMLSAYFPAVQNQVALMESILTQVVAQSLDPKVTRIEFRTNISEYGCDYHPNALYQMLMAEQLSQFIQNLPGWD